MTSLITLSTILGPQIVTRYNQFASAQFNGNAAPGFSSGEAMEAMERLAGVTLPPGYGFDWSAMSFQERKSGGQVAGLFGLALLCAYLFLVGQYESWNLPFSIIVLIPVAVLGALVGLWLTGYSLSIYAQVGLVLLVGLACKNAILIVEFAKKRREDGLTVAEAAVDGAKIRYRPVLMTAFTFILGVLPLVIASGSSWKEPFQFLFESGVCRSLLRTSPRTLSARLLEVSRKPTCIQFHNSQFSLVSQCLDSIHRKPD